MASDELLNTYHEQIHGRVDIAVIGGGINGLAIAREATARGLSAVIVERDDLGARTSGISTRLIHGGLKYLEHLDFRLVIESIRQRTILLTNAPHLVKPCPMLIPFSGEQSRPGWLLACGLALHDLMAFGKPLRHNQILGPRTMRRRLPQLADAGIRWAGIYEDAMIELSERLCVELAVDAAHHGARFLTHSEVTSFIRDGELVTGLQYRDARDHSIKSIDCSLVINAAGPWVDAVLDLAGPHARLIGPTKGSHLIVDPFPGAPEICVFFESPRDGRPMFVLPWNGRFMIGTTDLPYHGDLDAIRADADEVKYLLEAVNSLLPSAGLTRHDVLWSYSGVRPLPFSDRTADPAKVSRDHSIVTHEEPLRGLISVVGGKLTTHQALGKQVVDRVVRHLGRGSRRSPTRRLPFPGKPAGAWRRYREQFVRTSDLPPTVAARLVDVYGRRAEQIVSLIADQPNLAEIVDEESHAVAAEIVFAVTQEGAQTLEDILIRRTTIALNADTGLSALPRAVAVAQAHLGWDDARAEREAAAYRESVEFLRRGGSTGSLRNHT